MNPPLPLPLLLTLITVVIALAVFLSWRTTHGVARPRRFALLALRASFLAAIGVILLNPGRWVKPNDQVQRPWLVLIDQSQSMTQKDGDATRFARAKAITAAIEKHAADAKLTLRVQPFADSLQAPTTILSVDATGKASNILGAVEAAFQETAASGEAPAGLIVLSDGRNTSRQAALESLALRARARQVPVHTVALGAGSPTPDLSVRAGRTAIQAFAAQTVHVPVVIEANGLGALRQNVRLLDTAGKVLAERMVEVPDNGRVIATFDLLAPAASTRWTIATDTLPNEVRPGNNRSAVSIRVLDSKTRVFLAEGAPYWDSKFLAQLLRQQTHMEVHSVHRLSDQRYFRIDSDKAEPTETNTATFPETPEELSRYDLILLGKNIDGFMTPTRLEALRQYVRDHGGAVLFCRGKAATGEMPALEPLEPVSWGNTLTSEFRFTPSPEGEAAGLFGEALPAADASVWQSLPTLKDGRAIAVVKPFTRILATGAPTTTAASGKFPVLLVRRYGQGVTGLVNGDGLWKWDFYPEARELGNMYEEFWSQWLQWMAAYSEFLPGQDFSLRLASLHGEAGQAVPITLAYRGKGAAPAPKLLITCDGAAPLELIPAPIQDATGRAQWRATFTPPAAGTWRIKVIDSRKDAAPTPEVDFQAPAAPAESDDLSPDAAFLTELAKATGGEAVAAAQADAFFKTKLTAEPPQTRASGAEWQPAWNQPWLAVLLALLPTGEWFFRRRQGLV